MKEDQSAAARVRFPDVFSVAEGGPKCTEGGRNPWVLWRLAPGEFVDDGNVFVKQRR